MSIEIALMDISMAINAMNWTFVSPEMVAAWSMGLVISYILPVAAFLQPVLRHAEPVRGTFRNDLDLLNKLSLLLCRIEKDAVLAGGNRSRPHPGQGCMRDRAPARPWRFMIGVNFAARS
ncbi:hypothetical protein [Sinorhizobium meliloti]|uniref:hypothetical protein n=1 Tax=Rhizobium meliloti TaxID=382 RepID=UPI0013E3AFE9|nr:hypothetical protein [Sinorhizobium meliloti]